MIQEHYLPEDLDLLSDHLANMHNATISILKAATKADFSKVHESQALLYRSLEVVQSLHRKKLNNDMNVKANNLLYARRGWMQ